MSQTASPSPDSHDPPNKTKKIPWAAVMRAGLGVLGLPPESFWRMTPRELSAALAGRFGWIAPPEGIPTRQSLESLMARFPDRNTATSQSEKR